MIPLFILNSTEGSVVLEKMLSYARNLFEQNKEINVESCYNAMLLSMERFSESDSNDAQNNYLSKCQLSNGKTLWLCNDHQKQSRVNAVYTDTNEQKTSHAQIQDEKFTTDMMDKINNRRKSIEMKGKFKGASLAAEGAGYLMKKKEESRILKDESSIKNDTTNQKSEIVQELILGKGKSKSRACAIS